MRVADAHRVAPASRRCPRAGCRWCASGSPLPWKNQLWFSNCSQAAASALMMPAGLKVSRAISLSLIVARVGVEQPFAVGLGRRQRDVAPEPGALRAHHRVLEVVPGAVGGARPEHLLRRLASHARSHPRSLVQVLFAEVTTQLGQACGLQDQRRELIPLRTQLGTPTLVRPTPSVSAVRTYRRRTGLATVCALTVEATRSASAQSSRDAWPPAASRW